MSFDISKIDTQDVVNANKMLRISINVVNKYLKCAIRNIFVVRNIIYPS